MCHTGGMQRTSKTDRISAASVYSPFTPRSHEMLPHNYSREGDLVGLVIVVLWRHHGRLKIEYGKKRDCVQTRLFVVRQWLERR